MFVTRERLHAKWPTMKRINTGLLAGCVSMSTQSLL